MQNNSNLPAYLLSWARRNFDPRAISAALVDGKIAVTCPLRDTTEVVVLDLPAGGLASIVAAGEAAAAEQAKVAAIVAASDARVAAKEAAVAACRAALLAAGHSDRGVRTGIYFGEDATHGSLTLADEGVKVHSEYDLAWQIVDQASLKGRSWEQQLAEVLASKGTP